MADAGGEIEYWQGRLRLVAYGARDAAGSLPPDEATAAVVLGALLARHLADDRWPGEYRAVLRVGGSAAVVAEDDLRVAAARQVLRGFFTSVYGAPVRREFTERELARARAAVLALGPQPGASVVEGAQAG